MQEESEKVDRLEELTEAENFFTNLLNNELEKEVLFQYLLCSGEGPNRINSENPYTIPFPLEFAIEKIKTFLLGRLYPEGVTIKDILSKVEVDDLLIAHLIDKGGLKEPQGSTDYHFLQFYGRMLLFSFIEKEIPNNQRLKENLDQAYYNLIVLAENILGKNYALLKTKQEDEARLIRYYQEIIENFRLDKVILTAKQNYYKQIIDGRIKFKR